MSGDTNFGDGVKMGDAGVLFVTQQLISMDAIADLDSSSTVVTDIGEKSFEVSVRNRNFTVGDVTSTFPFLNFGINSYFTLDFLKDFRSRVWERERLPKEEVSYGEDQD